MTSPAKNNASPANPLTGLRRIHADLVALNDRANDESIAELATMMRSKKKSWTEFQPNLFKRKKSRKAFVFGRTCKHAT